jgi:hypothetical protein
MGRQRCRLKVISLLSSKELVLFTHKDVRFVAITLRGHELKDLVACLVEKDRHKFGDPPKAYAGRVLKPKEKKVKGELHWVVIFEELPAESSKAYWLFVAETGTKDDKGGNFSAAIEVTVVNPKGHHKPKEDDEISIQYPQNNATLPPSFTTYGIGSVKDLSAYVLKNNEVVATGDKIVDADGIWMFQFTNVPENTGYLLRVGPPIDKTNQEDPKDPKENRDSKQNLTVDGIQGEPIEAQPPPPPGPPPG